MSDTELPTVDIAPKDPVTSNITGLLPGAFEGAMSAMRKRISDKQKQAVATIGNAVSAGEAKIDAAAAEIEAKVDKEISGALQEFSQYSNGGPA